VSSRKDTVDAPRAARRTVRLENLGLVAAEKLLPAQLDKIEESMADTVEPLILDLLVWVAGGERSYADVMDVWRTSCPRLPVWEDAKDRGLVREEFVKGRSSVRITSSGLALLEQRKVK
jgi:hypothetical protein